MQNSLCTGINCNLNHCNLCTRLETTDKNACSVRTWKTAIKTLCLCLCVYSFITDIWLICNPVTKFHGYCNCTCKNMSIDTMNI